MNERPEADLVQAEVRRENGAWVVFLTVWTEEGADVRRVGDYRSEGKARIAARWIEWAAMRDIDFPTGL